MTCCRGSAIAIFVDNNIPNFECLVSKDVYSFTSILKVSSKKYTIETVGC